MRDIKKLQEPIFEHNPAIVALKQDALDNQLCYLTDEPPEESRYVQWILHHYPVPLEKPHTLYNLVLQMSEDVCIHRKDWLSWMFVCFPSGWEPRDKIGRSFDQIHLPVPGFKGPKLPYKGNFEREVWGLGRGINRHPRFPRKHNYITRERQVMIGFGDSVLFIIRQYLEPITTAGLLRLPTDPEMRQYKGLLR